MALFLPVRHEDITRPVHQASHLDGQVALPIHLRVVAPPRASYDRGVPKVTFTARDDLGEEHRATIFGNAKQWLRAIRLNDAILAMATGREYAGILQVTIKELIDLEWLGQIMPVYPGKASVIAPGTVRATVQRHLDKAIPRAAAFIRQQLSQLGDVTGIVRDLGGEGWAIDQMLSEAHRPSSMAHAEYASLLCRRVAHLAAIHRMYDAGGYTRTAPIKLPTLENRIRQMPFRLTDDQRRAIHDVARGLASGTALRSLIAGETGSGKTAVIGVILAAMHDAGRRSILLAPNFILASQLHREISGFFADIPMRLVTGEHASDGQPLTDRVLIGTSALLHRDTGKQTFDLVALDEQQRWSRAQREHHVAPTTHLVELSATPIPRTQALIRYGRVVVSEMRQSHRPKHITTHLYSGQDGARQLMNRLAPQIRSGNPVVVVLPKRELDAVDEGAGEGSAGQGRSQINNRHSVEAAVPRWEALFPGRVRSLTSDDDAATKQRVLEDVASGKASVICSTTVIEIGINLPNLYDIVIVCPERHGLTGLHQLRGRLARNGGEGRCHLLMPEPVTPRRLEALQFFAATHDGFALAEYDLRVRGAGDLGPTSDRQSGADETFLFGVPIEIALLDEVMPIYDSWRERGLACGKSVTQTG